MALEEDDAVSAAGNALEKSLMRAVSSVEAELERVMRKGQDDADRLVATIVEGLARVALDGALGATGNRDDHSEEFTGSLNQVAAVIAQAVRRGARFT
ncbi:MAG TPA: hypothetical protein VG942_05240 [Hyphomonadaceae bacterium]|nr:hypothetical protein [Hyphomonadaceae bacterium]